MQKAIEYEEGFTTEGEAESLSVICVAPWQGKLSCVLFHIADPVLTGADVIIRHHHRNGLNTWESELFREDPNECPDVYNVQITEPIALKPGDSISVEYANPDRLYTNAQIWIEAN